MRSPVKYVQRTRARRALDANCDAIVQHLLDTPSDFDGRESLWMERARLARIYFNAGGEPRR